MVCCCCCCYGCFIVVVDCDAVIDYIYAVVYFDVEAVLIIDVVVIFDGVIGVVIAAANIRRSEMDLTQVCLRHLLTDR